MIKVTKIRKETNETVWENFEDIKVWAKFNKYKVKSEKKDKLVIEGIGEATGSKIILEYTK